MKFDCQDINMGLMNILVAVDDNYVEQLIVMLNSLFRHNHQSCSIYLLHSGLNRSNINKLTWFVKKKGHKLFIYKVNANLFMGMPQRQHTTYETYYRLLAFSILDESISRILYLDPDLIINGSLQDMYQLDMKHYCFAGGEDPCNKAAYAHKKKLGIPIDRTYINAGVLLINLERLRKITSVDEIFKFMNQNRKKLKLQDQDVVNSMFYKEVLVISNKYNYPIQYKNLLDAFLYPFYSVFIHPYIVHYMGGYGKPWNIDSGYGWKYMYLYCHYAAKSPTNNLYRNVAINRKKWFQNYVRCIKKCLEK